MKEEKILSNEELMEITGGAAFLPEAAKVTANAALQLPIASMYSKPPYDDVLD